MKKSIVYLLGLLAIAFVSCQKWSGEETGAAGPEIILGVEEDGLDFSTKATAITALPSSLYWGATTGTSTEAAKWSSASASVSSSRISTGKYQTSTPTAYNYYVSNVALSVGANTTVTASNTTDVICGRAASTSSTTPSVALGHIFARTGTISFTAPSGYTASNVSYTIVGQSTINGTAGTYNLKTGAWTAASTKLSTATALTASSDMYLIPGTYTIKCTFTLTRGDFSKTYTQSGNVTLVQGKVNNITVTTASAEANQIVINLSLTAWANNAISLTVS